MTGQNKMTNATILPNSSLQCEHFFLPLTLSIRSPPAPAPLAPFCAWLHSVLSDDHRAELGEEPGDRVNDFDCLRNPWKKCDSSFN